MVKLQLTKKIMVQETDNKNLRGFKWIWVYFDENNLDKHQLFLKEHCIKKQESEYPKGRTLFLLNIPPYVTINSLKHAFVYLCGNVDFVTFTTLAGFKMGYLVFSKEASLNKALKLSTETMIALSTKDEVCATGIVKWCNEYNNSIKDQDKLNKEIETYMRSYDQKKIEQIKNEAVAEKDEDGWVTVTSRKKRGQFAPSRKESTIHKIQHKEEQKKHRKQLLNFYTFQIRDSKKQHLAELRKQFELDQKRLQELKSKRIFKPF